LFYSGSGFIVNPVSNDQLQIESGISQLNTDVDNLEKDLAEISFAPTGFSVISPTLTPQSYIDTNGNINTQLSSFGIFKIAVTPGDYIRITNPYHGSSAASSYCFYNSATFQMSNVVKLGPTMAAADDVTVLRVPTGATYIGITKHVNYPVNVETSQASKITDVLISLEDSVSEIPGIKSRLTELENAIIIQRYTPILNSEIISGYYINSSGGLVSAGGNFKVYKYAVTPGDKLSIYNNLHQGGSYSYAFYSSDSFSSSTCVGVGQIVTQAPDTQIATAPNNAVYLLVQFYLNSQQSVNKITEQTVGQAQQDLEQQVDDRLFGYRSASYSGCNGCNRNRRIFKTHTSPRIYRGCRGRRLLPRRRRWRDLAHPFRR
jgi:hypothetical protein